MQGKLNVVCVWWVGVRAINSLCGANKYRVCRLDARENYESCFAWWVGGPSSAVCRQNKYRVCVGWVGDPLIVTWSDYQVCVRLLNESFDGKKGTQNLVLFILFKTWTEKILFEPNIYKGRTIRHTTDRKQKVTSSKY